MKGLDRFEIDVFNLDNKAHSFDFTINDNFFENFEQNLLSKGALAVSLELDKSERMVNVTFKIKGNIELVCDRTLKSFDFPVDLEKIILFKFGDDFEEVSENLYFINRNKAINFANHIFELIALEIPMKKIHPDHKSREDEEDDEHMLIYSSSREDETETGEEDDEAVDPRWNALKDLKNRMN